MTAVTDTAPVSLEWRWCQPIHQLLALVACVLVLQSLRHLTRRILQFQAMPKSVTRHGWIDSAHEKMYSYLLHIDRLGVKMAALATLSSKFQISIPKEVRDEQHWEAGQEFVFIPKGKGVLLMPVPELRQLAGMAKGADTSDYRDRQDRY